MQADQSVSVVIPVRNEAGKIAACIEGILTQTIRVLEIVVVDSGSTDGTLDILARYPEVRVIGIEPAEFNHGETRNVGVRAAVGAWVLLTVGDARAADSLWIERLLQGFTDDQVAGVCGSQVVPHERDKNPIEWFRPASEPRLRRIQFASASEFDSLSPVKKLSVCSWDDVTAIYRRELLLRVPFRPVTYAEDALWAKDVLRSGHALVYNPGARVYHHHTETPDFTFRRTIATMYVRYRSFGYQYREPERAIPMLRSTRLVLREPTLSWRERRYWIRHIWRNHVAAHAADRAFRLAVADGERALDDLYARYCDRAPVPEKASLRSANVKGGEAALF